MMEFISILLPGMGAMMNMHPMLVHFPIGLLSGFVLMEILGYICGRKEFNAAAGWMLYLGTLGALAAVIAGLHAANTVGHTDEIHAVMMQHRNFGLTVLVLSGVLSLWRIRTGGEFAIVGQVIHLFLAVVMAGMMMLGADLGGLMVYKYGVAVRAVPQAKGHDHGAHGRGGHEMMMSEEEDEFSDIELEGEPPHDHGEHNH